MSAADTLAELEAEVWRVLGEYSPCPRVHHVDRVLNLAGQYASAAVEDALGDRARARRLEAAEASAAEHAALAARARLEAATAERTRRTG